MLEKGVRLTLLVLFFFGFSVAVQSTEGDEGRG